MFGGRGAYGGETVEHRSEKLCCTDSCWTGVLVLRWLCAHFADSIPPWCSVYISLNFFFVWVKTIMKILFYTVENLKRFLVFINCWRGKGAGGEILKFRIDLGGEEA